MATIRMTRAEYEAKYGSPVPTSTPDKPKDIVNVGGVSLNARPQSFIEKAVAPNVQKQQEINTAYQSGQQGIARTAFQTGGNLISTAFAPAVGGIGLAVENAPAPLKDAVSSPILNPAGALLGRVVGGAKKAMDFVSNKISDIPAVQKFAQTEQSKALERDIEAVNNYLAVLPVGKITGTAGKVLAEASALRRVGEIKNASKAIDELSGKIVQGDIKNIPDARKALTSIDIEGVKTYSDLSKKIQDKVDSVLGGLDEKLAQDKTQRKLDDIVYEASVKSDVGETTVRHNFAKDAINDLKELYTQTNDPTGLAQITLVEKRALEQGLTTQELNNLARKYGSEFSEKAFTKTGEPRTTINAQTVENTRTGLKNTARQFFGDEAFKAADTEATKLLATKKLVDDMAESVNTLKQKVNERGLGEKVGRAVFQVIDAVSGGTIGGFVRSAVIPRGGGLKTLNALDLEKQLPATLKKLKELDSLINKTGNEASILQKAKEIIDSLPQAKAGMYIEDVTKSIHPEDIGVMEKFIDSVRLEKQISDAEYELATKLMEKFGISQDKSLSSIANEFDKILSGQKKVVGTAVPGSVKKKLGDTTASKDMQADTSAPFDSVMLPTPKSGQNKIGQTLSQVKLGGKTEYADAPATPLQSILSKARAEAQRTGNANVGNYDVSQFKGDIITVYHGTNKEVASKLEGNAWNNLNNGSYVSLTKGAEKEAVGVYGAGYYAKQIPDGEVVALKIPVKNLAIDNATGELRYVADSPSSPLLQEALDGVDLKNIPMGLSMKNVARVREIVPDQSLTGEYAKIQERSIAKYKANAQQLTDEYLKTNGKVVNTDEARKLFKDVGYTGDNAAAVQEASSAVAKDAWESLLKTSKEADSLIYAGGSGTGKTSAVKNIFPDEIKDAGAILDGNLSSIKSATARIQESIDAGKYPTVIYVYRDPADAWVNGVIKRMKGNADEGGRIVPLSVFVENHKGSYDVVKNLLDSKKLGVDYDLKMVDNSLGAKNQALLSREKFNSIKYSENLRQELESLTKELYEQGKITKVQYEALIK